MIDLDKLEAIVRAMTAFLNGDSPYPGTCLHFGDSHPERRGKFWWRGGVAQMEDAALRLIDETRALRERVAVLEAENAKLRGALKPFADTDLTSDHSGSDFAWDVLRARAALAGETE